MVVKRKGSQTKEKILECAKEEFYHNGYNETQLKTIGEKTDIRLGNLNYYFKKKDDIVKEIYTQFFTNIYDFIELHSHVNELQKFSYFQAMVYTLVLNDNKSKRFYSEIIQDKSNYRVMHELMREKYRRILDTSDINFSSLDFEIIILSEFGSRREIFLNYFEKQLELELNSLIYYVIKNMYKQLEIPVSNVDELIADTFQFVSDHDFSSIRFLV